MSREGVPILRVDAHLLVTLQGDLDDATVLRLEEDLTHEVERRQSAELRHDVFGPQGIGVLDRHALALGPVFELIAANLGNGKVGRCRMADVKTGDCRRRHHGAGFGEDHFSRIGCVEQGE